jgi:hypothetical protein
MTVGKQETVQLAAILLLLGWGDMKPSGHLPEHFIQCIPYCHHIDAEGVAERSVLLKQFYGCCRLGWKGSIILKDWCKSSCLGVQRGLVCWRVIIFIPWSEILAD